VLECRLDLKQPIFDAYRLPAIISLETIEPAPLTLSGGRPSLDSHAWALGETLRRSRAIRVVITRTPGKQGAK
jgi:hypothetical protein